MVHPTFAQIDNRLLCHLVSRVVLIKPSGGFVSIPQVDPFECSCLSALRAFCSCRNRPYEACIPSWLLSISQLTLTCRLPILNMYIPPFQINQPGRVISHDRRYVLRAMRTSKKKKQKLVVQSNHVVIALGIPRISHYDSPGVSPWPSIANHGRPISIGHEK